MNDRGKTIICFAALRPWLYEPPLRGRAPRIEADSRQGMCGCHATPVGSLARYPKSHHIW